jgi:hypothetical protein
VGFFFDRLASGPRAANAAVGFVLLVLQFKEAATDGIAAESSDHREVGKATAAVLGGEQPHEAAAHLLVEGDHEGVDIPVSLGLLAGRFLPTC